MRNRVVSFVHVVATNLCIAFSVYAGFEPRTPLKWDEFSQISCAEELARLDSYADKLGKLADALAVVVVYAGAHDTREGEVVARLFGIRDRLIHSNAIDRDRIIILNGGFRERLEIQLWILPSESRKDAPLLINPELSSKDVHLKKAAIRKWKYNCHGKLN